MTREQPEQAPPPVQRLRVRYAKRGRLRFTSHRDFSRAFERAVFRARLPMAYSSGFNPHPRISYAGAAPTGSASEAEYLELALAEVVDPASVHAALDEAMPDGLDVVEVVESPGGGARRPAGRPATGRSSCRCRSRRPRQRSRPSWRPTTVLVRADDEEGAARLRQPGRGALAGGPGRGRQGACSTCCCGTSSRRSAPTTCSPGWLGGRPRAGRRTAADPAGPGAPGPGRPARSATRCDREIGCLRSGCAILAMVDHMSTRRRSLDPAEARRSCQTATRPGRSVTATGAQGRRPRQGSAGLGVTPRGCRRHEGLMLRPDTGPRR